MAGQLKIQEAQLSLKNRQMLVHARCCAIKSCSLVNDCDLLAGFSDIYLPTSHSMPSMRGIPSSYLVHIWWGKTRMAGLRSGEGRLMIDSVVWAQYINVTDTQTATSPQQMPRQRTAPGGKNWRQWEDT